MEGETAAVVDPSCDHAQYRLLISDLTESPVVLVCVALICQSTDTMLSSLTYGLSTCVSSVEGWL